jgi:hypothetical protein
MGRAVTIVGRVLAVIVWRTRTVVVKTAMLLVRSPGIAGAHGTEVRRGLDTAGQQCEH